MINDKLGGYDIATYSTVSKALVSFLLVVWWLYGPTVGYASGGTAGHCFLGHFLWPLSHANVWHLAGNLYFLWVVLKEGRLYMRESYVMAVLCSFLPVVPGLWDILPADDSAGVVATCGFSGVLCAMIGVRWGRWMKGCHGMTAYGTFARRVLPFVAVGFVIPHVNWSIHLYCLMAGVVYGVVATKS